jgi:cellulose biosynthesis protein BcsQ
MTIVIAQEARKGGVGKTTTTVHLAAALARDGYCTVIIEGDGQGNATGSVGLEPRDDFYSLIVDNAEWGDVLRNVPDTFTGVATNQFYICSASDRTSTVERDTNTPGRIIERINQLRGWADVVLIDTSPGLNQVHAGVIYTADYVIIPSSCELDAINGANQVIKYLDAARRNAPQMNVAEVLGVLPTRARLRNRVTTNGLQLMSMMFKPEHRVFDPITEAVAWNEARNRYMSIWAHQENVTGEFESYDEESARKAVVQFRPVVDTVRNLLPAVQQVAS